MPHQDPKKKQTPRLKKAKAQVTEANAALAAAREVGSKIQIQRLKGDSVTAVAERSAAIRAMQGLPELRLKKKNK